jgi:UDP-glucose:(heptosyl)LPS alpha-1,3-glucosyltransferase
MRILQIAPEIEPGSGVGGVAYQLEQAWQRAGIDTARFTLADAGGARLPAPGPGVRGKLALLLRVVWFSTVGTVLARRALARLGADTVSLCHNDVLAGDVYVNHGILRAAMRARGGYLWRMARNPLHLFTAARDALRYRSTVHRVVVNLTDDEEATLRRVYPHLRPRTTVIGNGVDTRRFRPPTEAQRRAARATSGVPDDAFHVVFVGHEFARKGLPLVLEAAAAEPRVHVGVVGGTKDLLAGLEKLAAELGVRDRVHLAGQVRDPLPWLHAADALALPSAYEANALVVLEALACGVPVVATPVGYAPQVVNDGVEGYLVERTAEDVRRALVALADTTPAERDAMSRAARRTAEDHDWDRVAEAYLSLLEPLVRADERPHRQRVVS